MIPDFLYLNSRDYLLRLDINHIVYFEADGNYTNIISANKVKHTIGMTLAKMQELRFYRYCPWIAHTNLLAKYHRATVQEERQVTYTPKFGSEAFHL